MPEPSSETIQVEPSVALPMDPMVWTLIDVVIESCSCLQLFSNDRDLETKLLYHEYLWEIYLPS